MKRLPFKNISDIEFSDLNVKDFESRYKLKIPTELIEFLKIQNGGTLDAICFLDKYYINHFYPLWDNRHGTISQRMEFLISEEIEKMIPFAGDDDSLTFCIGIGENNDGKIFSYQACDWTPGEKPLLEICESFDEFIKSFKQDS